MKTKLTILLVMIIFLLFIFVACDNKNYGEECTYYSQDGKSFYFDGKGICDYDGIRVKYYVKDDVYYIANGDKLLKFRQIRDGVLADTASINAGYFNVGKSTGFFNYELNIGGEECKFYDDGTFDMYNGLNMWMASGNYYFNDNVLVLKATKQLTVDYEITMITSFIYMYIDNAGNAHRVMLSEPGYYQEQHGDDSAVDNDIYYVLRYGIKTYNNYSDGDMTIDVGGHVYNDYQVVKKNDDGYIVQAKPNYGYKFVCWSDGETSNERQDKNIKDNIYVSAIFEKAQTYNLTYLVEGAGKVIGARNYDYYTYEVYEGNDGEVMTAVPDYGYRFVCWSDGITTVERQEKNVHSDHTVTAMFEKIEQCYEHEGMRVGQICGICGKECYARINDNVLMYDAAINKLIAEYYEEYVVSDFSIYNNQIEQIYISEKVIEIGNNAFSGYSITSVEFDDASILKRIGVEAFSSCKNLKCVELPQSVNEIGERAFNSCTALGVVDVGDNIVAISSSSFMSTKWWDLQSLGEVIYIGNICYGIRGKMPLKTNYVIKDGTRIIADNCFEFQGGLRNVKIPASVINIGNYAFNNCRSLISVTFDENSLLESIGLSAFNSCSSLASVNIPYGVAGIGDHAFWGCSLLESVIFENTQGWWFSLSSDTNDTEIPSSDLAKPSTAAKYLTETYYNYYWKRR